MNKEFIPYEQALALKELGFDEPCFAKYKSDKLLLNIKWNNIWCENINEFEIYAPTYSQAFRWFREKYGLHMSINVKDGIWYFERFSINGFKTYEEAELACLKKLIEIVNERKGA